MNITFRQGSEQLSSKLVERAQMKLTKLSRLMSEQTAEAFVHVDVERESRANHSESLWRASINLEQAGDRFNATGTGETPDKAIELAIKDLKREVRKSKGKTKSIARRGSEMLKKLRRTEPTV